MSYRNITPSIRAYAGVQGDQTETLYDVKEDLEEVTVDVDRAKKYTDASKKGLRTGRYLDLMGLRDQLSDVTKAEQGKAWDAFKLLEGWHSTGGGDWFNVLGLGSHYNYNLPLGSEYKDKGS